MTARSRHSETLLQIENSRLCRIYHSEQIEQNGKISCLWFDFDEAIKKVSSANTMKEHVTENLDVH